MYSQAKFHVGSFFNFIFVVLFLKKLVLHRYIHDFIFSSIYRLI